MSTKEEVLSELPNDNIRAALLDIIENNIRTKNYVLNLEAGSTKGDNYIGIVYRLIVTCNEDDQVDSSDQQKLGIFIKIAPVNRARREQFFVRKSFLREFLIYDEYLPLLREFQETKGIIPKIDGFHEYPQCYRNITSEFEEAIFMEDLSLRGFYMKNRRECPTVEDVKIVMRILGKFHALSYAIKDQWPKKFAKFKNLTEIFKRDDELFINYINGLCDIAYDSLSNKGDEGYLVHVKAFVEAKSIFQRLLELTDGSRAEPYAVVCHGDCWNNNILFKYENDKPVDARLLDWQIARFASPVCDLVYYVFCCTTKAVRDKYLEDILDTYYSSLASFLQRLGSDASALFPRKALEDQLKEFGSFALVMGLMLIPSITTREEDVPDLDEFSERVEAGDEEYCKQALQSSDPDTSLRIRDVIIDLIKLECI